jgi:two-component system, chemotaxis family, protein-glutamate methylesterase/glutaminase
MRMLVERLPTDLEAALVLMLHTGPGSFLAETLGMRAQLPIREANSGTLLLPGTAYVAPSGAHIVVNPDARLSTCVAGRIRLFRPSADWLFESAAASFGDRHIAVVLSGLLTDGAQQIRAVKRAGGMVLCRIRATRFIRTCRWPRSRRDVSTVSSPPALSHRCWWNLSVHVTSLPMTGIGHRRSTAQTDRARCACETDTRSVSVRACQWSKMGSGLIARGVSRQAPSPVRVRM